jgi:tetratricopeptide (TPR) repeat protein
MVGRSLQGVNGALGKRPLVWAGLLAVAGVVLSFIPLFDVLGYDYAFALGLGTAVAAVDVGHGVVAAARRAGRPLRLPQLLALALAGGLGLLVLPLLIALGNALRVRNCNLAAGLAFYALLPVGTALFAAPAGMLCGLWLRRGGRVVAFLLPLVSVLWTLGRLYVDPAVFAFDPFGGYFPGPIYDEALRPPGRLLLFRVANLVWIGGALALCALGRLALRDRRESSAAYTPPPSGRRITLLASVACVLVIASVTLFVKRGPLGFHVTEGYLRRVLGRETRSAHFVVRSDPHAGETANDRALVVRDLEFRYQQLARILGATPATPITVFLFPSSEAKKQLVGAGGTLYAKPWKREIFVQAERFPARKLRHEMAHVFAGAFGDPLFGVSLAWRLPWPRLASGLIEGTAEAADFGDPDGRSTVHQEARAMIAAGLAPPLAQVMGAGFTALAGARAYTIAGSFTHFLLASRGAERLRAIYRSGGDFEAVYGTGLAALEKEWRAFLETQPVDQRERARAQERFRRPAIFQKVCARELAARVQTAHEVLYSEPEEAVALLDSVCADDPHEPLYRLDLADARAAAGEPDKALAVAAAVEGDETMTAPLRERAANVAASLHYHAGRFAEAAAAVERALGFATDDGDQRTGLARRRALRDEESRRTLGRVLFGESPTRGVDAGLVVFLIETFARRFPDEALGPYLLGRQLAWRDPALALPPLEVACPLAGAAPRPVPLEPVFLRECHRLVGETAFRAGDFARSRLALERSKADAATEAERLRATDFLERLAWEERRVRDAP